ncbi:hypothetical protein NSTC745_04260 [Nostoc sp. DSM 114161]|jgi:hypothetical protein|uniref:hypothetical protein n=1 Tax=Nostoc sp. DSM 114161 TaxID=3440143 RepID=UPI0040457FE6
MTPKLTLVLLMDTRLDALISPCGIIKNFSQEDYEIDFISSPVIIWQKFSNRRVTQAVYGGAHFRYRWNKQVKSSSLLPSALFLRRVLDVQTRYTASLKMRFCCDRS